MATVAEVLAKANEWEAAGNAANAAKLRAYAKTLPPDAAPRDAASVLSKADEWDAAGQPDKAAKLRAYAGTLAPVAPAVAPNTDAATGIAMAQQPPRADAPASPVALPRADTIGDTAGRMMEGPKAAMGAFGAGLMDTSKSPSRAYLANDPATGNLPGFALDVMGGLGDLGGAALSTVGAGLSGLIGLGTELVPGQDARAEGKLGNDLLGMSMFAVPELAGGSSVAARAASVAPKAIPKPPVAPSALAGDVAAARDLGIPVMRTDVSPPTSGLGKTVQRIGENTPFGSAGLRAEQQTARIEAAQNLAREYGGDSIVPAIDDVAASVLAKRSAELTKYSGVKRSIVDQMKVKGNIPVPSVLAEIDNQIAAIKAQRLSSLDPVIAKLNEFKAGLADQPLDVLEKNRQSVGSVFADQSMASIRDTGEKALSALYDPLRNDINAFIKANGGDVALASWKEANGKLSAMAGDLKNATLKSVLKKGEATPEQVGRMLFSAKPSDIARLKKSLTPEGMASARTAIIQKAVGSIDDIADLSPEKFRTALRKLGPQVDAFFEGKDYEAVNGLRRALRLTEQAAKSTAAPLTGVQNVPVLVSLFFGGTLGLVKGAAATGGVGIAARIYEKTGVQRALRGLAKAETPKAEAMAIKGLDTALRDAGVPIGQAAATEAANSNRNPEYEALRGRY